MGATNRMSVAMMTYTGRARLKSNSQHMLHDGRSTIANVEPSTLVPAVVIESMSSWVSRLCSQTDGEDVLNAFAYSSAFHPMCMAIVETIQQIPIAVQVGMASLAMRRSW